jgi:negative regulator of sigma-B (phosphoserine phosphatase)
MPELDYFLAVRPLAETGCGDAGIIKESDNKVFVSIVDVLGHVENADEIAMICADSLEKNCRRDLLEMMGGLHQQIKGSQGAVVGLCLLALETGELTFVGIGNIAARKFGYGNGRIIPKSGIIYYTMPHLREERMTLTDGDVPVLHTDGVKEHFDLEDYPELLVDDAEIVANHIINQFGKAEDDACCIALRYQR